jgi:hypothetical protein
VPTKKKILGLCFKKTCAKKNMSVRREVGKSARRVLDLKYLASFRSSVQRPQIPEPKQPEPPPQSEPLAQSFQFLKPREPDAEWPHFLFATSASPQPCFDKSNALVEGADLEVDERVLLVVDRGLCRTTRVATTGELITARVDLTKFKDFQPVP